jgi:hypothetical protein
MIVTLSAGDLVGHRDGIALDRAARCSPLWSVPSRHPHLRILGVRVTLLVLRATAPARALGVALVIATLAAMAISYWARERTDPQCAGMTV